MDYHPDHMHTGYLAYIIVKQIREERKRTNLIHKNKLTLLLYQSYKPNFFIRIRDISIQVDAWSKHRSQTKPLFNKILRHLRKVFYFFRRIKTGPDIGEGFRKPSFEPDENQIHGIFQKIQYILFRGGIKDLSDFNRELYTPIPTELGLKKSK